MMTYIINSLKIGASRKDKENFKKLFWSNMNNLKNVDRDRFNFINGKVEIWKSRNYTELDAIEIILETPEAKEYFTLI